MEMSLKSAVRPHIGSRALLLALLSVVALLAITPAPAGAQAGDNQNSDDQNSGNQCTPDLDATRDETVARFSVDCPVDSEIMTVTLETSEGGRVEGTNGTSCNRVSDQEFRCEPGDDGTRIDGRFMNGQGESVCAEPRLTVDFLVDFEEDMDETLENIEVGECSENSGGDGDDGTIPEGGIDSGAGGTSEARGGSGAEVAPGESAEVALLGGAAVTVLALAGGGLALARRRAP